MLTPYYKNLNSASQRDMQVLNKVSGELEDANVWDLGTMCISTCPR